MAELAPESAASLAITVESFSAEPNDCPLEAPLRLAWQYRTTAPVVAGCCWEVAFVLDIAYRAHSLLLGRVPADAAPAGALCSAEFSCGGLEVASLEPRRVPAGCPRRPPTDSRSAQLAEQRGAAAAHSARS